MSVFSRSVKYVTINNIIFIDYTVTISVINKNEKMLFHTIFLRKDEKYGLFVN